MKRKEVILTNDEMNLIEAGILTPVHINNHLNKIYDEFESEVNELQRENTSLKIIIDRLTIQQQDNKNMVNCFGCKYLGNNGGIINFCTSKISCLRISTLTDRYEKIG